jgi:hypothetical protein
MTTVELRFANATQRETFATQSQANEYANNLFAMYSGHEKWFNKERNCYIVTAEHIEVNMGA